MPQPLPSRTTSSASCCRLPCRTTSSPGRRPWPKPFGFCAQAGGWSAMTCSTPRRPGSSTSAANTTQGCCGGAGSRHSSAGFRYRTRAQDQGPGASSSDSLPARPVTPDADHRLTQLPRINPQTRLRPPASASWKATPTSTPASPEHTTGKHRRPARPAALTIANRADAQTRARATGIQVLAAASVAAAASSWAPAGRSSETAPAWGYLSYPYWG